MVYFNNISPQTWEHPADKAALDALKAIKGFDQVLKYVLSITDERQEKLELLSTCIKASEKNYPNLYKIMKNTVNVFGWDFTPEIFVKKDMGPNAYTGGVKEPYIVIYNGWAETFSDEELTSIIGHEMGHIMSGHVLYDCMMRKVVNLATSKIPDAMKKLNAIPFDITLPVIGSIVNISLKPIQLALSAWSRKSELTADRAGLLAVQDPEVCHRLELKLADFDENIDLDDLYKQALEYDSYNSVLDNLYKINNYDDHPNAIIRVKELEAWVLSGKYQEILNGTYLQRNNVVTKAIPNATAISNEHASFCGNCGKKIPEVKFCPFCGSKV